MRNINIIAATLALSIASLAQAGGKRALSTIYTFADAYPGGLVAAGGVLYGVTSSPTDFCGTVFELDPPTKADGPWTETTLHTFGSTSDDDGCGPASQPVVTASGAIYGLTNGGGTYDHGAVYELLPPAPGGAWSESVIWSFDTPGPAVGLPGDCLIAGPNGSLYAPTGGSGTYGSGALVQFLPPSSPGGAWTPVILYSFYASETGTPDWLAPGPGGILYATSSVGGTYGGTILRLTPPSAPGGTWANTVLYNFQHGDGNSPNTLLVAPDGKLYGTTLGIGSADGDAAVFELAPPTAPGGTWTFSVLRNFGLRELPWPLTLFSGRLFGMVSGYPIFELKPPSAPGGPWTTTYVHNFDGSGQYPGGTLVIGEGGTLYGTTVADYGDPASGTVFSIALE
jgi:hypothetical protein